MSYTFLQYDKRWASHLYPLKNKKHSTMSTSGCAPTSLSAIIYNINNKIIPPNVADYSSSIGGATEGGATYHWAITKIATHYGFQCKEIGTMSEYIKLMKTGKYWGIILFNKGTRGGITWTKGGHYVANTDAKGTDLLYMRDSGQRKHTGWYSYSKHMRGLIKKAWILWTPNKPTPTPTKSANEKAIDGAIAFAEMYAADNSYKYKKWTSNEKTHQCPICHPNSGKGWNCIGFVSACLYHGAGAKIKCSCSGLGNDAIFNKNLTLAKWKARNGNDWTMPTTVSRGCVVLCYDSKGKYKHTALYIGNGKIVDATSKYGIAVRDYNSLSSYKKKYFKYTGKGRY